MAGVAVGLAFGAGLFCLWWAWWAPPPAKPSGAVRRPGRPAGEHAGKRMGRFGTARARLLADLVAAEVPVLTGQRLIAACGVCALLGGWLVGAATGVAAMAVAFAVFTAYLPVEVVRSRARHRTRERRDVWPDVVDNIASAVRAGLALPEAVAQIATRGPVAVRPAFAEFAHDYRLTGRFGEGLDLLRLRLADPVADRLIESLRLARDVGGTDLGRLLRTLSGFLRDDARTRAELEARQSWSINAARLAVVAPWLVLAMLATRADALAAYDSPGGVIVLVGGFGVTVVAYRLMRRIGRLPNEERVLR